ncbi:CvpA family protein [Paraferrimonas sp. SM1919]|uniref:CvpA family protein n=1 Tax=Paraferrimonas sp. SM1919 TaxID=2662263 RepID=UPI0013D00399|nr:CvpA family protein [Paraferrimonas sp. SM1919]
MVWIDYLIIGIIAISTLVSLVRGFAKEAMSLVVWITAFIISSRFYEDLSVHLTQIDNPTVRTASAIGILFIATLIIGAMVNYILGQLVIKTGLSGTDRVLGLCFGAIRGVLITSLMLLFLDTLTPANQSQWWQQSVLIPELSVVVEWFFDLMKQNSSLLPKY